MLYESQAGRSINQNTFRRCELGFARLDGIAGQALIALMNQPPLRFQRCPLLPAWQAVGQEKGGDIKFPSREGWLNGG